MKRETTGREKIFSKHVPTKGLLLRLYKYHLHINKKKRLINRKMAKDLIRHFTQKDINMDK